MDINELNRIKEPFTKIYSCDAPAIMYGEMYRSGNGIYCVISPTRHKLFLVIAAYKNFFIHDSRIGSWIESKQELRVDNGFFRYAIRFISSTDIPTIEGIEINTVHIDEWDGDIKSGVYEAVLKRLTQRGRFFITGNWKTPDESGSKRKHRKKTSDYTACNTDEGFGTLQDRRTKPWWKLW